MYQRRAVAELPDTANRDGKDAPSAPPAGQNRAAAYLLPGQLVVAREPTLITTVLGSCVAVCLWDSRGRAGGMNHYLLPAPGPDGQAGPRFGIAAVPELLDGVRALAGPRAVIQAKVFGGACVLNACRTDRDHLGRQNVELALRLLQELQIPVVSSDTEGQRGRKLVFDTSDGSAWVKLL